MKKREETKLFDIFIVLCSSRGWKWFSNARRNKPRQGGGREKKATKQSLIFLSQPRVNSSWKTKEKRTFLHSICWCVRRDYIDSRFSLEYIAFRMPPLKWWWEAATRDLSKNLCVYFWLYSSSSSFVLFYTYPEGLHFLFSPTTANQLVTTSLPPFFFLWRCLFIYMWEPRKSFVPLLIFFSSLSVALPILYLFIYDDDYTTNELQKQQQNNSSWPFFKSFPIYFPNRNSSFFPMSSIRPMTDIPHFIFLPGMK